MQSKAKKSGRPSEWKSESEKWNPQRKVTNIVDNTARSGADQSAPLKGEKYSTWPDLFQFLNTRRLKLLFGYIYQMYICYSIMFEDE